MPWSAHKSGWQKRKEKKKKELATASRHANVTSQEVASIKEGATNTLTPGFEPTSTSPETESIDDVVESISMPEPKQLKQLDMKGKACESLTDPGSYKDPGK